MLVLRRIFEMVPILTIPVLIYALFGGVTASTRGPDVFTQSIEKGVFVLTMPSGAPWALSGGDLLLMMGLIILFFELTRGVGVSRFAIIHHTLAVLLALSCAGAFLLFEAFLKQKKIIFETFHSTKLKCCPRRLCNNKSHN